MARYSRKRRVRHKHVVNDGTVAPDADTVTEWFTIALQDLTTKSTGDGVEGTLTRILFEPAGMVSGSINTNFTYWGLIAPKTAVAAEIPCPVLADAEDRFASYLFIGTYYGTGSTTHSPNGAPFWHQDVKAMRKMTEDDVLWVGLYNDQASSSMEGYRCSLWWYEGEGSD